MRSYVTQLLTELNPNPGLDLDSSTSSRIYDYSSKRIQNQTQKLPIAQVGPQFTFACRYTRFACLVNHPYLLTKENSDNIFQYFFIMNIN